jgi:hypothetical protein
MTKATGPRYTTSKGSELDGCIDPQNDILCARGFEFGYIASVQEARSSSTDRDVVVSWIWQIHALCRWLYYFTGCTWQEALPRTLCADVSDEDKRPSSIHNPPLGDLGIFTSPDSRIQDMTVNRRLFFSSKDHIGLTPYNAQPGDKICIIFGSQFPIVL